MEGVAQEQEVNPNQSLQEFIELNCERLQASNEILQQAGEYHAKLIETGFRKVDSYSALAAIYIAAHERESPYMYKKLKVPGMKIKKFFHIKDEVIEHLKKFDEYTELRKRYTQPAQLVDQFCRELNIQNADIERIYQAIQHIGNSENLAFALSEHADTQVAALILMATAPNHPMMERVSHVTHVSTESIQNLMDKLEDYAIQLFPA